MYDIGEPYLLHNQRGASIDLYPFAYNPQTQILRVYYSLIIKIDFLGYDIRNTMPKSAGRNKFFDVIYKNHFLNHSVLNNSRGGYGSEKMLIICKREFIDEMQPFIVHKNNIGLRTEIVAVEDIGNDCNKIKQFIKNSYNKDNQLTFVLLVGDFHQITTFLIGGGGSDPSYSLINGDDNYPDIIVGRFSAENEFQVSNMVYKTIRYETAPKNNQAWFNKGLGIASNDGNGHGDDNQYDWEHLREIRKALLNWRYTSVAELYDGNQGEADAIGNPTEAMVANVVNDGVSIINYTGHGNTYSWATSNFSNINVNRLTNTNKLPFIFSVACLNGNFTLNTCFAETWLRAINNNEAIGAIGFYGSSINQSWQPPMEAQDKFNELFYNENFTTFGELCFNGACSMIDKYKFGGVEMFLTWNYFGDPSVSYVDNTVTVTDLYVRDSVADIGNEPSGVSRMWVSPDIWIEDMDGNKVDPHGNDVYNVCVRVHNKSDYPSSGREVLLLNWTKGGLDLDWNGCWFGMKFFDCDGWKVPRGSYVNDARGTAIPIIQPHRSEVVRVKWLVPRREDYKGCDTTLDKELWHFCLLARIHDGHPIYLEDDSPANLAEMIVRNNNVALRNITVLESKHNRSIVSVGNPFKELRSFSLLYTLFKNEKGELLNKYADVYLNMSSNLFELFEKSGFEGKGFKVVDKNKILLTEPTATIERLVLQPEELYLLEAEVNFFTQEDPENNEFTFDIAEYVDDEKGGKELIGGETYIAIRNSERDSYFKAKAVDDKTVLPAEPVSFRAEPISEDAVYTWFDQKGDTVAHGLNLTVTPTSTQHYKLEVIATADGFKDYDSVRATVRNGAIVSLSPNPTDNQLTITYRLAAGITNATIEISDMQNLSVQSYPVTATATTKTVSLAGLTAGTYVVKLIVNGETVDTRQVIKN